VKQIVKITVEDMKVKALIIWSDGAKYNRILTLFQKGRHDGGHGTNVYRTPGGARRILKEESARTEVFLAIRKAIRQGAKTIDVMISATRDKSKAPSKATLRDLKAVIQGSFPSIAINLIAVHSDGAWELMKDEEVDTQDQD